MEPLFEFTVGCYPFAGLYNIALSMDCSQCGSKIDQREKGHISIQQTFPLFTDLAILSQTIEEMAINSAVRETGELLCICVIFHVYLTVCNR